MRTSEKAALAAAICATGIAAAYWMTTGGVPKRSAPATWLAGRRFAHRGLHSGAHPENSLGAFAAAAEAGYGVELDVRRTADGALVVMHDAELTRMTGDPRAVSDVTLADIRRLRLSGTAEPVPTLHEALDAVGGRVPVLVEIKSKGRTGLEDAVASELSRYEGPAAAISFNPLALAQVARAAPEIARGQLVGTLADEPVPAYQKALLRKGILDWKSRPDFVAFELATVPSFDAWLQRRHGRPIVAWTAENPADLARAERLADAVICEPEALGR